MSGFDDTTRNGLLFFWAEWHEPSVGMRQVVEALQIKYPSLAFTSYEAEQDACNCEKYKITVVPTFVAIFKGQVLERIEGVNAQEVAAMVKRLFEKSQSTAASTTDTQDVLSAELEEKIKRLIYSAPVMLFMKGNPGAPRCGFSRQICEILTKEEVPFASFDILGDEEVRQGLKKYSDWPTFPQLYAHGSLIGGLDIVKEMLASATEPLKYQLGVATPIVIPTTATSSPLEDRIKALLVSAPVMLFMKGSPAEPKCGFSRTIVGLLQTEHIAFSSFDILSDEQVRQGLKILSDWPTYPQLYVRGELVGGLDIVQDMLKEGPLQPQLAAIKGQAVAVNMDHDHDHVHSASCGHSH